MNDAEYIELLRAYDKNEPYFGHVMHADQGHHRFKHFPKVVECARKAVGRDALDILEIGSWAGASLVAWDNACESDCRLTCIDHWMPYLEGAKPPGAADIMTEAAVSGSILRLFWHNVGTCGLLPRLRVFKGFSRDILPTLDPNSFDIIFIDGNHLYDSVNHDIVNTKPLLRNGGVMCGDDMELQFHEVIDKGMYRSALQRGLECVRDGSGPGYHPGVTEAVHCNFGYVQSFDGLWVRQKVDDKWEDMRL